jgi:hypothetical protein
VNLKGILQLPDQIPSASKDSVSFAQMSGTVLVTVDNEPQTFSEDDYEQLAASLNGKCFDQKLQGSE